MEQEARDILQSALDHGTILKKNVGAALYPLIQTLWWRGVGDRTPRADARAAAIGLILIPMTVLDVNVVSEFMRADPQREVLEWLDDRLASELHVSAITEAQILTGIASMPEGRRSSPAS